MKHEECQESMRHIGESLKRWRTIAGITADGLAQELGISRDTLSRAERGDLAVSVGTVLDMAADFGLLSKVEAAFDPAQDEIGRIGIAKGLPKRVRRTKEAVPQDWRNSMNWYEGSFVYQIYPLGLTGAPWRNDGSQEGATNNDEHRLLKIVNDGWVDHMKKLGVTCLMLKPGLRERLPRL
jgi:cyclomaltodextrinase / maltogenic alpha-amylase / neopullulanase